MTTHERFTRMFEHREADRIPIIDSPWATTIARWKREGMPENADFRDYFGLDKTVYIGADNSPRFEEKVLEENDRYVIFTTKWGGTQRRWRHVTSTPEHLDFIVKTPEAWQAAKARIRPDRDRVDWARLERSYATWRSEGWWVEAAFWFGFDITHSHFVGTERLLIALIEQPDWVRDMFGHLLDTQIQLFDAVWNEGYRFDAIRWPDDMGFKGNQFFSLSTYRDLLRPFHKKAIDWAHAKGVKAHLHSCGNINPFVPDLIDIGLDALNPLEVKAGMDPVALKRRFGTDLVFHGGINAVLWDQPDRIREEMERVIPVMKQSGGYIFSSDHSVPDAVSLEDFRGIVDHAKRLGRYA